MDDLRKVLDRKLSSQSFANNLDQASSLDQAKQITRFYNGIEGGISVLSDMKARKSYAYYGALAVKLGLQEKDVVINSIWEDELLSLVHNDDLRKKYSLELRFFQFLNSLNKEDRPGYEAIAKLRATNSKGEMFFLKHRIIYINLEDGDMSLSLCQYNLIVAHPGFDAPDGIIHNTRTGEIIGMADADAAEILSSREREIIGLIKRGNRSKDIAFKLGVSIHTINRHRQNIFSKLNVTNAMEACRIAEALGVV